MSRYCAHVSKQKKYESYDNKRLKKRSKPPSQNERLVYVLQEIQVDEHINGGLFHDKFILLNMYILLSD